MFESLASHGEPYVNDLKQKIEVRHDPIIAPVQRFHFIYVGSKSSNVFGMASLTGVFGAKLPDRPQRCGDLHDATT